MSGVKLARGTVVAAGAVVTHSTEPYSIVGGVPATCIKYRFPQAIIDRLMQVDFSKFDESKIKDNVDVLCEPLTEENIDVVLKTFFR